MYSSQFPNTSITNFRWWKKVGRAIILTCVLLSHHTFPVLLCWCRKLLWLLMLTNVCGIVEQLQIGHHLMVEKGFLSLYSPHASLVSSLSIQSCLFSLSVECMLPSPPPPPLPGSITSFQLAVLMSAIHLLPSSCLSSSPSAISVLLCHFFSICSLDRQLYLLLSVSP